MVRALHEAGIEVILDVVYNHTAEGNHLGPTLCFRGIDNQAYYRLEDDDPRYYSDYTGTGNSLNVRNPHALQLIMDSLRYWVTEMHVDGFRFDLAAALAREFYDVDRLSSFFELVQQDPIVSQVKLIAEPWDVGPGGYQVGNFPPQWTEWNGKYRDTVRDFWRGEPATIGEFAARITGSADLYEHSGRRPVASINFVTATTGSRCSTSSPTTRSTTRRTARTTRTARATTGRGTAASRGRPATLAVLALRAQQRRNFFATLFLSQGVPMLCHGDELGRTQSGNNNGYCQDTELTWVDWTKVDVDLLAFVAPGERAAPAAPGVPAAALLRRPAGSPPRRGRAARHRVVHAGRPGDDRGGLGGGLRPRDRGLPQRAGHPRSRHPGRSGSSTTRSSCASPRTTRRSTSTLPSRTTARPGRSCSTHGRPDLDDGKVVDAGGVVPVGPRALVVLQRAG